MRWFILSVLMLTAVGYAVRLHSEGRAGGVTDFFGTLFGVAAVWLIVDIAQPYLDIQYTVGFRRLSLWIGVVVFAHLMEQRWDNMPPNPRTKLIVEKARIPSSVS